jgi:hypothetical protein
MVDPISIFAVIFSYVFYFCCFGCRKKSITSALQAPQGGGEAILPHTTPKPFRVHTFRKTVI